MADPKEEPPTDSEDESEGEDVVPFVPAAYLGRGPRSSVSAEAYGDWNKKIEFVPTVYAKSGEQTARIRGVLERCFLFNTLDEGDVAILIGAMVEVRAEPGQRLIREGEDGDAMFLIEQGVFDCLKVLDGQETVLKRCEAGDFFGELALLYNCPRAASVEARSPALLWQLDRRTFNHIVRDASVKKREMYEEFLNNPLFQTLGSYERLMLADSLRKQSVTAGSVVISQGDPGQNFYLVEDGTLVAQKDGQPVMTYSRGMYFGELALLESGDHVRHASVIAQTDSRLLWIDRRTFSQLLGSLEEVMRAKAAEYA